MKIFLMTAMSAPVRRGGTITAEWKNDEVPLCLPVHILNPKKS